MRALALTLLLPLVACGKGDADGDSAPAADAASCGDLDGEGGDTGDLPNLLGGWTTQFGANRYDDGSCSVSGLSAAELGEVLGGVLKIDGRVPDALYATLNNDDLRYYGLLNTSGGVVFTGTTEKAGHTLYVSFGGLLYRQPQTDRDEMRGFAYIGVDLDGADTVIDCWLQGDWRATRSGS